MKTINTKQRLAGLKIRCNYGGAGSGRHKKELSTSEWEEDTESRKHGVFRSKELKQDEKRLKGALDDLNKYEVRSLSEDQIKDAFGQVVYEENGSLYGKDRISVNKNGDKKNEYNVYTNDKNNVNKYTIGIENKKAVIKDQEGIDVQEKKKDFDALESYQISLLQDGNNLTLANILSESSKTKDEFDYLNQNNYKAYIDVIPVDDDSHGGYLYSVNRPSKTGYDSGKVYIDANLNWRGGELGEEDGYEWEREG